VRQRIGFLLHHTLAHGLMGLGALGLRRVARAGAVLHTMTENHAEHDYAGEMETP